MSLLETGLLLADILLAVSGLILAIMGIVLAGLGVFGYLGFKNWINELVKEHAEKLTEAKIKEYLNESNIDKIIRERAQKEGDSVYYDIELTKKEDESH